MTQLQIKTQFSDGHGSIEMWPQPDEESRERIRNLGIMGISCIKEPEDPSNENLVFFFNRVNREVVDKAVQTIMNANISFAENSQMPPGSTLPV